MGALTGKRIFFFLALDYHVRYFLPVIQALEKEGATVRYFTAPAEADFEMTLVKRNLPYFHILDYLREEDMAAVRDAARATRAEWLTRIIASPLLQAVPLPIQDKVLYSTLEAARAIRNFLQQEQPDMIFALHELNSWGKLLGYWASTLQIPYVTFQEGLCYAPTELYQFHTEYSSACVVWGERDRQVLLDAGGDPEKIAMLGNMNLFSEREQYSVPEKQHATRQELGVGQDSCLVLFLLAYAPYSPFLPLGFLDWLNQRPQVEAVFKWHPLTSAKEPANILQNLSHPRIHSHCGGDASPYIAAADVCVLIGNSTTGIEVLAFGKPLIEVPLPDMQYRYATFGVCAEARGFEDLPEKLSEEIDKKVSASRAPAIADYLAANFAYQDTQGPARVVNLARDLLRKSELPDE